MEPVSICSLWLCMIISQSKHPGRIKHTISIINDIYKIRYKIMMSGLKTHRLSLPRYCARGRSRQDGFSILQFFKSVICCKVGPDFDAFGLFDTEYSPLLPSRIAE